MKHNNTFDSCNNLIDNHDYTFLSDNNINSSTNDSEITISESNEKSNTKNNSDSNEFFDKELKYNLKYLQKNIFYLIDCFIFFLKILFLYIWRHLRDIVIFVNNTVSKPNFGSTLLSFNNKHQQKKFNVGKKKNKKNKNKKNKKINKKKILSLSTELNNLNKSNSKSNSKSSSSTSSSTNSNLSNYSFTELDDENYTNLTDDYNMQNHKQKNIHNQIINIKKKINKQIKKKYVKKNVKKNVKKHNNKPKKLYKLNSASVNTTDVLNEIYNVIDFEFNIK
jgi:hypothetical protein